MSEDLSSFEVLGVQMLRLLEQTDCDASLSWLLCVMERWSQEYDRAEKVDSDKCNRMHVIGGSLCVLLHRCSGLEQATYDLHKAFGNAGGRVLLCDKQLQDYDIQELQNLVTALQLEFCSLYRMQEAGDAEAAAGYGCVVDMEDICVRVMAQLGKLQSQAVDDLCAESSSLAVVHGLLDITEDGYRHVRVETMVFLLDALHSMYSLHALLTRAHFLFPAAESSLVSVHAHHREASNETFFTTSITGDCAVGTIAQYAHRFAHLFHSVSQTIYYNYPTYCRQTQLSLLELQKDNVRSVNLLPLLTELRPDIPVLFEHTGAGFRHAHGKHAWSWVLWSNFVLLVDRDLQGYVAADARTLVSHAS